MTHLRLFKSQVVSGGQSSTLERLSEGRRMLSSCQASCTTRPPYIPPLPPFFLCFEIAHLLALIPSFTPSSSHPISLPHSPFSPLSILRSSLPFSFLLPFLLSSPTFPLTSLPFSLSSPPFLSLPPFASPPSFHKMRLVVGW